jgi:hypothetical protein
MNRKFAPLFITPALFLYACGGGSSSGGSSGGGGTTPQAISVSFPSGIPPASVNGGAQTPLEANVANDSANGGVTWSCTPAGSCGSFNPSATTSGNPTTYIAPVGASAPASVTVTATSVTDPTKTAHATVVINAIAVQLAQPPPTSLPLSGTASVAATVLNDSANAGATWSCAPTGSCGSFSATTTPSGTTTTYTAPPAVPSGGSVTITATSVTDTTKSVQASVSVTSNVTVTLSQAPPATLPISGTASVTATVTNDSANAGVTWTCTPAGSCGSFSPTSTPSGTATTYTAPAAEPSGPVRITATSVTDPSKFASANAFIPAVALLKGQYAFLIQAPTGVRGNTTWVGSVTLDGTGKITAGVEDIVSPTYNDQDDVILPTSTYTVDSTGHGTMTMLTTNGETLGISFVATSPSHAEIIEADPMGGDGGDPASGTLDLQTPAAFSVSQISGDYSFTMTGIDISSATTPKPYLAFGGEFSATGSAVINTGAIDVTTTGAPTQNSGIASGSFDLVPDANGRGSFHIVVNSPGTSRTFIFYVVSSKVLRLMESDGIAAMGGSAYSQGAASTTLSGNYIYQHSGWTSSGRTVGAGQFSTSSSSTSITGGVSDANSGAAAPTTSTTASPVSGSYTVVTTENDTVTFSLTDAAGTSTLNAYFVDPTLNILDPNNLSGGGGALLLHTDTKINGVGILLPQATPAPFAGGYALNLNNSIAAATPNEVDLVGVLSADGVSGFGNTNLADYDQNDNTNPSNPMIGAGLTGSFAADTSHSSTGRCTGSFTVTQPASSSTGKPYSFIPGSAFTVAIYPTGNSQAFIVETDKLSSILGRIIQQNLR